ncbi:MAG TPA: DUF6159 family protein [Puia sp.]|nr:DUF6159 family protein [Puia sp.]
MNIFTRMSNGWNIAMNSWAVLKENRQLILFPILSGISMLLVILSFFAIVLASAGWDLEAFRDVREQSTLVNYLIVFGYYLVNYFIIVFFNTALIHCTHLYFNGEKPTIRQGLQFSLSRIGVLLSWAAFAATVGTALRILQDNLGSIGKFVTGLIGIVWSIATFFVVPVIAYENLGPIAAFKRSAGLMKQKWGERLGAGFSFGLIQLAAFIGLAGVGYLLGWAIHPVLGIAVFVLGVFAVLVVVSAVKAIFISAVYHNINGNPVKHFNQQFADQLFVQK